MEQSNSEARAPVLLTCSAAAGVPQQHVTGLCDAVQAVLADKTNHPVRQVTQDTPQPETTAALWVYLHFPAGHNSQMTAQLGWRPSSAKTGLASGPVTQGPEMSFGVTDTALDARFYDPFAHEIVQSLPQSLP